MFLRRKLKHVLNLKCYYTRQAFNNWKLQKLKPSEKYSSELKKNVNVVIFDLLWGFQSTGRNNCQANVSVNFFFF